MSEKMLVTFPGNAAPDKARESFRNLQASLEIILSGQEMLAKVTRAKYDALIAEGFTQTQAIELCKG